MTKVRIVTFLIYVTASYGLCYSQTQSAQTREPMTLKVPFGLDSSEIAESLGALDKLIETMKELTDEIKYPIFIKGYTDDR